MTTSNTKSDWRRLLRIACGLIRQVNEAGVLIDGWTLGGGTALMVHIDHRESRDIDVFLSDPQHLALLNPERRDFQSDLRPGGHTGDGSRFLKLAFDEIGEIDFIVGSALTPTPAAKTVVEGEMLLLESVAEIITKKIYYRAASLKPRDIFDIAASGERHAESIVSELKKYMDQASSAASTLERLNPKFVAETIQQLAIKPPFESLAQNAHQRAREILRTVVS